MGSPNILVVDDDPITLDLINDLLTRHHMQVATAKNAADAETRMQHAEIDLIVLDVMMPNEDGTSFCRRIRQKSNIPVLMLSALAEDVDRVVGLEIGADDYMAKPFNPRELVARIKSILRRAPTAKSQNDLNQTEIYSFDSFRLLPAARVLETTEGSVDLTTGEFSLLLALVERAPRVLSRDQLIELSRGAVAEVFDRSIDTHISRLRSKIEPDPRKPIFIKTVRNMGYVFAMPVAKSVAR